MVILGIICKKYDLSFPFLFIRNGSGYCSFFLGVLLYEFCNSKLFNHKNISIFSTLTLFALSLLSVKYGIDKVFGNFKLSFSLFIVPTIIYASLNIKWITKLLSNRFLSRISLLTMPIFLSHQSVMSIVWTLNNYFNLGFQFKDKVYFVINIIIIFGVGILWYFLLQKGLIPLLNKMIKKFFLTEYFCAVEPPFRCSVSDLSESTELPNT